MTVVYVLVAIVVALLVLVGVLYNRMVRLRNEAGTGWANIDVQLRRRNDLIPNLVEAVKGYAAHERGTFEAVTQARAAMAGARGPAAAAEADNLVTAVDRTSVRRRRGLPRPEGERELPAAAARALGDGGQDRRGAAVLQRHRPALQQRHPDVPGGAPRRVTRVLRRCRGGAQLLSGQVTPNPAGLNTKTPTPSTC